jgi:predicted solute-binding protein
MKRAKLIQPPWLSISARMRVSSARLCSLSDAESAGSESAVTRDTAG